MTLTPFFIAPSVSYVLGEITCLIKKDVQHIESVGLVCLFCKKKSIIFLQDFDLSSSD
jgi:hypothetical protein